MKGGENDENIEKEGEFLRVVVQDEFEITGRVESD
jgi:hypothetical protein